MTTPYARAESIVGQECSGYRGGWGRPAVEGSGHGNSLELSFRKLSECNHDVTLRTHLQRREAYVSMIHQVQPYAPCISVSVVAQAMHTHAAVFNDRLLAHQFYRFALR
jgi:hypothetical protein